MVNVPFAEPLAGGVILLIEHVGGSVVGRVIEHVNETGLLNPTLDVTVTVEVADWPAAIIDGVGFVA
jgi:hypothetical protein